MRTFTVTPFAIGLIALQSAITISQAHAAQPSPLADRIAAMIEGAVKYPDYVFPNQVKEGDVIVTFSVGPNRDAENVRVVQVSGHRELDLAVTQAIEGLRNFPREAVGRPVVEIVQFRDGAPEDGTGMTAALHHAIAKVLKRWPDALVPSRYQP